MKHDVLTVEQQRTRRTNAAMAAIGLEAKLRLLAREILGPVKSSVAIGRKFQSFMTGCDTHRPKQLIV